MTLPLDKALLDAVRLVCKLYERKDYDSVNAQHEAVRQIKEAFSEHVIKDDEPTHGISGFIDAVAEGRNNLRAEMRANLNGRKKV